MAIECEQFEAMVLDFLYDELPKEKRVDVDAHAATCGECGKLHRELTEAREVAKALPPRIDPPSELDERILIAARAAADQQDVRRHPIRGGALHVAAAAMLVTLLAAGSFAVGVRYGKPRPLPPGTPGGEEFEPLPTRPQDGIDTSKSEPLGVPPAPPSKVKDRDPGRRYQEELLQLAGEKLDKGNAVEALKIFRGIYATGGRGFIALEAHLGIARALKVLGKTDEALQAADGTYVENDAWGIQDSKIDKESSDLVRELKAIKERLR